MHTERHSPVSFFFFFNDTATTEIYTLSLHDALPILSGPESATTLEARLGQGAFLALRLVDLLAPDRGPVSQDARSEEHTSELQSQSNLVCRLLLEKKKKTTHRRAQCQKATSSQVQSH